MPLEEALQQTEAEDQSLLLKQPSNLLDRAVRFRTERDSKLAAPTLLLPSIQVNICAGRFPDAEANGVHYLRIPVKQKSVAVAR